MFLSLRTKSRKGPSVQVDYIVHVQEITPWPPSQSLKSLRSVVLHWEYGDSVSGLTSPVVPSVTDGRIEFNKSFKIHVTLIKDGPVKGHDGGHYHKNLLELNLYEPRNKNAKGQHIGGVVVDLAEHGILKKPVSIGVPFSCKRSFKNISQPIVFIKIQPVDKTGSSSSLESLPKEVLSDKDGKESVSSVMTEENTEIDIASFTDDDNESQQSSNDLELNKRTTTNNKKDSLHARSISAMPDLVPSVEASVNEVLSTYQSTFPSSSINHISASSETDEDPSICSSSTSEIMKTSEIPRVNYSVSSMACQKSIEEIQPDASEAAKAVSIQVQEVFVECNTSTVEDLHQPSGRNGESHEISSSEETANASEYAKVDSIRVEEMLVECNMNTVEDLHQPSGRNDEHRDSPSREETAFVGMEMQEKSEEVLKHSSLSESLNTADVRELHSPQLTLSNDGYGKNTQSYDERVLTSTFRLPGSDSPVLSRRSLGGRTYGTSLNHEKNPVKSVQIQLSNNQDMEDVKEIDVLEATYHDDRKISVTRSGKVHSSANKQNDLSDYRIRELEKRVKMLERELREIAAIEISLYSVVAEHGSSSHKVHAPARRLSRLYSYALENWSLKGRASAARSIVSGLIISARACGNDVPRLTFWLSNSVIFRTTITPIIEGLNSTVANNSKDNAISAPSDITRKPSLKWEPCDRERDISFSTESNDWQDPKVFLEAIEKVEAWIFSRIIESIWWQVLTPRMQSGSDHDTKGKLLPKSNSFASPRMSGQRMVNYSIDLWKNAFKEAYERLCPIRAEGHECGCLPMLSRLVMEQCIARLDVAMFNAVLRESDDDIPGNPLSDPISDSKVLPIPEGKLSFGAGAQLKNAIGSWSRWLTDIFGIDDELSESKEDHYDGRANLTVSLKTFNLLNALSDLLMLPKDLLLDSSTRKEICPIFSGSTMKRILYSFVPDEFCPDPIPDAVFGAFDSEDIDEDGDAIASFPCEAAPVTYSPPSMTSVMLVIGHTRSHSMQRNSSSVLRKCHTSDDELDELTSPLTSIIIADKPVSPATLCAENRSTDVVRYQLLRDVWSYED